MWGLQGGAKIFHVQTNRKFAEINVEVYKKRIKSHVRADTASASDLDIQIINLSKEECVPTDLIQ